MNYKIVFPTSDLMWDFQEKYIKGNYGCSNPLCTIVLHTKYYPQEEHVKLAKEFKGKLVEDKL